MVAADIPNCQLKSDVDQINVLTTWLDASNVYGSTEEELENIRRGSTPFLKEKSQGSKKS